MNHDKSNAKWLPWLVVNDDRIKSLTKMDAIRADEWRVDDGMRATNGVGGWNVKQLLSPVKWIVNFSFDNNENRSEKYTQKWREKKRKIFIVKWERALYQQRKEEERAKQLKNSKLKVISQSNRRHSWRLLHREPFCSRAGKWKKKLTEKSLSLVLQRQGQMQDKIFRHKLKTHRVDREEEGKGDNLHWKRFRLMSTFQLKDEK